MPSYSPRGDQVLAQVRKKEGGVVVFSESKLFPTQGQAETWAEALERSLKKNGVAATSVRSKTLGSLILDHLEYLEKIKQPVGLGRSATQNHHYMAQEFRGLKLGAMTMKHFVDWAIERKNTDGAQPPTIAANLSVVSAAIHAAEHAHGLKIDPAAIEAALKKLRDVGIVGKAKEVTRLVMQEEEDALRQEFRRRNLMPQTSIDMDLMYQWALALPRRPIELCKMRWADVDRDARTILLRGVKHPRRGDIDQVVPLLPAAWELLQRTPAVGERILPYKSDSVCTAFENVRNRIADTGMPGIRDLRFYDLRHTGITMCFWEGHPIEEVALVSGHTNWTTLKRYTHIKPEDLHRRHDPKFGANKGLTSVETLKTDAQKRRAKTGDEKTAGMRTAG
jgi:integrase